MGRRRDQERRLRLEASTAMTAAGACSIGLFGPVAPTAREYSVAATEVARSNQHVLTVPVPAQARRGWQAFHSFTLLAHIRIWHPLGGGSSRGPCVSAS